MTGPVANFAGLGGAVVGSLGKDQEFPDLVEGVGGGSSGWLETADEGQDGRD
jgi:hypothetical protein